MRSVDWFQKIPFPPEWLATMVTSSWRRVMMPPLLRDLVVIPTRTSHQVRILINLSLVITMISKERRTLPNRSETTMKVCRRSMDLLLRTPGLYLR